METGKLDQLIRLQQRVETNVSGSLQQAYADDSPPDDVWALVISERGGESFQSARTQATEMVRVKIRYRDDVDTTWRMIWNGNPYEIKSVDRSQRRAGELWFTAEAKGVL